MTTKKTSSPAKQRAYSKPKLRRVGAFDELTRTGGGNQVQDDATEYPNLPTVS